MSGKRPRHDDDGDTAARSIQGVSAASLVSLKAELLRAQDEVRAARSSGIPASTSRPKRTKVNDLLKQSNRGVELRQERDLEAMRANEKSTNVQAALEKKAELYEAAMRGDVDKKWEELTSVDFLAKRYEHMKQRQGLGYEGGGGGAEPILHHDEEAITAEREGQERWEQVERERRIAAARHQEAATIAGRAVVEAQRQSMNNPALARRQAFREAFIAKQAAKARSGGGNVGGGKSIFGE